MSPVLQKQEELDVIKSDAQHRRYMNWLLGIKEREHPTPEEQRQARVLSVLIEKYEKERFPIPDGNPLEVLNELIEGNGLRQKDLVPVLGRESVVSEIMHGKRSLSMTHIMNLSRRFNVSPAVFFPRVASNKK